MIVLIIGPTGVGKTKLSVELAKKINAEIINGDAMQVYKKMNIATAKIREEEKEGITHHLFDIKDFYDDYTIYDYQKDGRRIIDDILSRGKNVVIVGGSALYIKALLYDYNFTKEDKKYDFSSYTNQELYSKIIEYDNEIDVHVNNRKRLERYYTKILNNSHMGANEDKKLYDFKTIFLTTDRNNLYNIINKRVDLMVEEGLINEAKYFYDQHISCKSLDTVIGYKELFKYFEGKITLDEALELIKKNSRHYAKRQYTFFKNKFDYILVETNYENFNSTVREVLDILGK